MKKFVSEKYFVIFCADKGNGMHETSLIQNLFDLVREQYPAETGTKILSLTLECGAFSNVEPVLLKEAFSIMKKGTEFEPTELYIEVIPTEVRCFHCEEMYSPDDFPFVCPYCGNLGAYILRGDDLILKHIEMEVSEHA